MSVLDISNVSLSFGENTLFDNVSFDVKDGEKVGLVGVNGIGKTSLFKIITGEYTADSGLVVTSKACKIGYMEQHTCSENKTIYEELVSVFDYLREIENELKKVNQNLTDNIGDRDENIHLQDFLTEKFNREGGLTYESRTRSTLIGLGFNEEDFSLSTSKLSGGQKSKLILGKLLLSKSDLLLLDEPTNHLDINAVEWLESFLKDFKGAALIVSHDRYFLDKITTKTVEIENKKMRQYVGNYSVFLEKKAAEQKAIKEKYENDLKEIARLEGIVTQQRQWNREKNIKTAESKEKVIEKIKNQLVLPDKYVEKIRFNFSPKCESGEDVLEVKELSKSFDDKKVFDNVSFDVKKRERVFLLGDNGCGKTTLLKILIGDYSQNSGKFRFGANLFTGYFDQVQAKLDLNKTALDEVWTAFPSFTETKVRNALAAFLYKGDDVYKPLNKCSGGERARIALLKLMLGGYNFLLLDEPTNHLDSASREELENTLMQYDGTMLIVSHDRYFINKLATRIVELTPVGCNNFIGNYDDYIAHKFVAEQEVKEKAPKKVNEYQLKKEQASALRKAKTALARNQENIEKTEKDIAVLEEKIASENDYQILMDKTALLDEKQSELNTLYEEWEELEEKLTLLSD